MANLIAYASLFQSELQKLYFAGCTSSWMENNAGQVKYNGGKYVYMPSMEVDGLGDYSRTAGYPRGAIATTNKQYELTQDRGRDFVIDAVDIDESGYVANVSNLMAIFQTEHVNPEIDAYRYSTIYQAAKAASMENATAMTKANVFAALLDDLATLEDKAGDQTFTITLSAKISKLVSDALTKTLDTTLFKRGEVFTQVKSLDGNPLLKVPSSRLKTGYTFYDGKTTGEEAGGFIAAEGAKDINWIITPVTAPIAVAKVDLMRIFPPVGPGAYQEANAWKTDYRLYHDLWMTDKAKQVTLCNTGVIS